MISIDPQIQTNLSGTHIPTDGSGIAPGAPDPVQPYGVFPSLSSPTARVFRVNGPPNAVFEAYYTRPFPVGATQFLLQFDIRTDEDALAHAQVIETDHIVCFRGFKYNLSFQLNYQQDGWAQIVNQAQEWTNVPAGLFKPLPPNIWCHYDLITSINPLLETYSFEQIWIAGARCLVAPAMQNLKAVATTWPDQVLVQVPQLALNASGGAFEVEIDNMRLISC
jgi:hypothetical protein